MKFINFTLQTNVYISVAAVFLTLASQIQLGMQPQLHPYLFIIFFATLFEYNLHRLITILTKRQALEDVKHKWVKNNMRLFYGLVVFSVVGFMIAIFLAKRVVIITLAPIALLTLFYSFPIFKNNRVLFRLREIPFLKIFLIAFVWSASTIFLPIIQSGKSFDSINVALMLVERFLFIFAITIPFDIRDMEVDSIAGLTTIPLIVGEKRGRFISDIILIGFIVVVVIHCGITGMAFLIPAFIVSALSTIYFINSERIRKMRNYHYGILDGTMLFQGLLVCLSYYAVMLIRG